MILPWELVPINCYVYKSIKLLTVNIPGILTVYYTVNIKDSLYIKRDEIFLCCHFIVTASKCNAPIIINFNVKPLLSRKSLGNLLPITCIEFA